MQRTEIIPSRPAEPAPQPGEAPRTPQPPTQAAREDIMGRIRAKIEPPAPEPSAPAGAADDSPPAPNLEADLGEDSPQIPTEPHDDGPEMGEPDEIEAEGAEFDTTEGAAEGADDDVVEVADLAAFAEHSGYPIDELYNLQLTLTDADGRPQHLSLGELKDEVQAARNLRKRSGEIEETFEKTQQTWQKLDQELRQQQQTTEQVIAQTEQFLMSSLQGVDWNKLYQEDPSKWAAMQQYGTNTRQFLDTLRKGVEQHRSQAAEKLTAEQEAGRAAIEKRERDKLVRKYPVFGDAKQAEGEISKTLSTLSSEGFDLDNLKPGSVDYNLVQAITYDSRLFALAWKAAKYEEMRQKGSAATKKVARLPKSVTKPGGRQKRDAGQQQIRQLRIASRSGNPLEAKKAITQRIGLLRGQ